jgi:hypothetical protein
MPARAKPTRTAVPALWPFAPPAPGIRASARARRATPATASRMATVSHALKMPTACRSVARVPRASSAPIARCRGCRPPAPVPKWTAAPSRHSRRGRRQTTNGPIPAAAPSPRAGAKQAPLRRHGRRSSAPQAKSARSPSGPGRRSTQVHPATAGRVDRRRRRRRTPVPRGNCSHDRCRMPHRSGRRSKSRWNPARRLSPAGHNS